MPRVPDGMLVYAVGDIHGRLDLLREIVARIEEDYRERSEGAGAPTVIFLGDYVDRGPESKQVIDFLLKDLPDRWDCRFLKGNHEDALLTFLRDPKFGTAWIDYGGLPTLASYGVAPVRRGAKIEWASTAGALEAALPRSHVDFLARLPLYQSVGDYLFVHAGIRPGIPLEYQSEKDMLWIREEFISARRNWTCTVVYGHTPSAEVALGDGRIGIDTGAHATGKLTAIGLSGADRWLLST
jgi:serine/threonine protein phosphatase 1